MRKAKARIGDVCEISTPAGLAYVQYTHDQKSMGQLVRVLPGLFATRPLPGGCRAQVNGVISGELG